MAPLQPGEPLHEYLREEVVGTIPEEVMDQVRRDWRWMLGRGPLLKRASNSGRRLVADRFVRDRVAVVPGRHGWRLHPLMTAFASMQSARAGAPPLPSRKMRGDAPVAAREPGADPSRPVVHGFGGLHVVVDGSPLPDAAWPAAARRLLELLLSLPGGRTTAGEAAEMLWPHHPPRAARNSFNVALHGLRRALEPGLMEGSRSRFVLREGRLYRLCLERISCDVEDFTRLVRQAPSPLDEAGARRLQAAIDLHSGEFLATCGEEFAEERRRQVRAMLLSGLERLGQWYAGAGRSELAVPALERLVGLEPGRRDAWDRLRQLHQASGGGKGRLASTG